MKLSADKKRRVVARLRAAGVPVPPEPYSRAEPDLRVESLPGSRAFDLKNGSECLLNVRISNVSYGSLQLCDPRANLLDEDWQFSFQEDARQYEPERKMYRMLSGRRIGYDSVLNHHLSSQIAPGVSIEGWLLAFNLDQKIPWHYLDRQVEALQLVLTDSTAATTNRFVRSRSTVPIQSPNRESPGERGAVCTMGVGGEYPSLIIALKHGMQLGKESRQKLQRHRR